MIGRCMISLVPNAEILHRFRSRPLPDAMFTVATVSGKWLLVANLAAEDTARGKLNLKAPSGAFRLNSKRALLT